MKVSVEWVNGLLDKPLSPRAMADALELAGIEVEELAEGSPLDEKIVVGKVLHAQHHPNADKLKLTSVDTGSGEAQIVCGAPNVGAGQTVAVALPGAVLPGGMQIKSATIRGEESHGMICSEQELGLGQNHEGILVLDTDVRLGTPVRELLTTEDIIDVKTAANRWDLNGIVGITREVAAQSTRKLQEPEVALAGGPAAAPNVSVDPATGTHRYLLQELSVDARQPTPGFIVRRLRASGVRPISVVVDITNYVMLLFGQPLHAFDADKVKGRVSVRDATPGETLVTLDGVSRTLAPTDIVIADESGAIGVAGVMGGENTEIDDDTQRIFLESASFNPARLRKTAVRYGLRTDASARFERGLPPQLCPQALAAAAELLASHAGATVAGPAADTQEGPASVSRLTIEPARIGALLGMDVTAKDVRSHLATLGFGVGEPSATGSLTVDVPWWRPDVTEEADVAEEVMKLIGHAKLPATIPPLRASNIVFDRRWPAIWDAKAALRSLGMFELTTYSFISQKQIEDLGWEASDHLQLKNPLSSEQSHLRSSILPSFLATAQKNRAYGKQFAVFELSKVFVKGKEGELPDEPVHVAMLAVDPANGYGLVKAAIDRLSRQFNVPAKVAPGAFHAVVAHPSRSGEITVHGKKVGVIGQLHPALLRRHKLPEGTAYLEMNWQAFLGQAQPKRYRPLSKYPAIERDVAVVVAREVTWDQMAAAVSGYQIAFVNDYYGDDLGAGKKSVALRITVQREDGTPTDSDAEAAQQHVVRQLEQHFQARLRTD